MGRLSKTLSAVKRTTFYDNFVDNLLRGYSGNDHFYLGAGGFDTVYGEEGWDQVILPIAHSSANLGRLAHETIVVAQNFAVKLVGVEVIQFLDQQYILA